MQWFYACNGQQAGPVSEAELDELVRSEVVSLTTLVWKAGMKDWQQYGTVFPPAAPPLPETPSADPAEPRSEEPAREMRHCASCGNRFPVSELATFGESSVCAVCKPAYIQRLAQGMTSTTTSQFRYAGFWIRVVASFIDGVIMQIVRLIVLVPAGIEAYRFTPRRTPLTGAEIAATGILYAIQIAYYVYFNSQKGATPGKMALGLKIVRSNGEPISVGLAFGRYFAQILDALILCIGFMMAGWDDQKRTLHDRICDTRVVRVR